MGNARCNLWTAQHRSTQNESKMLKNCLENCMQDDYVLKPVKQFCLDQFAVLLPSSPTLQTQKLRNAIQTK